MDKLQLFDKLGIAIFILPQFFVLYPDAALASQGIKVKAVPPVYSVEVKDVTLYEATIPIFFHVKLPTIPDVFPSHTFTQHRNCTTNSNDNHNSGNDSLIHYNEYHCALERQFILAANHIVKDLKEQMEKMQYSKDGDDDLDDSDYSEEDTSSRASRKKRQAAPVIAATSLLAGFLLRPAVSKFTGNLFGSNEEWISQFNSLRESLIKDHELLLDFEESTQAYTQEMSTILTTMSGLLSEQKRDLIMSLHLLATKMHADMIQDAVHSCRTKHLPGNLIKPDFLRRSLISLDQNTTTSLNYTLAMHPNDNQLGKYYKLPIADCLFTKDTAHITVNVPLRSNQVHWKLHEIIHTKFAFHHQICEIYPQEAAYFAEAVGGQNIGHSVLITNHMLRYCSIYEDKLCMVPRLGKDSVQSLKCTSMASKLKNMVSFSQNLKDMVNSCSFRCYPSDELVITQVDATKVVVTNAKNITYECGGVNKTKATIHLARLGAVEVNLECDCSIKINDENLIPKLLPCTATEEGERENGQNMFSFTVPFMWAHNLSQFLDGDSDLLVDDNGELGAHINNEWPRLVPVLNFSKEEQDKIDNFTVPQAVVQHSSAMTTVSVWLVTLTVVVFLHVGLTFYCCFKLFFAKFAQYEMGPNKEREHGGWFARRRSYSGETSHRRHHSNRHSHTSTKSGSSERESDSNLKHNFDTYQKNRRQHEHEHDKLNDSKASDGTSTSLKSHEDSYHNNRNSVCNRLI